MYAIYRRWANGFQLVDQGKKLEELSIKNLDKAGNGRRNYCVVKGRREHMDFFISPAELNKFEIVQKEGGKDQ
ncbi:MAG: hypothetical protein ABH881_01960 [bacterium]